MLAIDNTRPSKLALGYAVQMAAMIPDLHFVLLHIQPMVSLFLKEEARTSSLARKKMEKILNRNVRLAQSLLDEYQIDMIGRGIASDRIEGVSYDQTGMLR